MRCEVLKTFKRRGEPQLSGSILEVPKDVIVKLKGYIRLLGSSSADSYPSTNWRPEAKAWLENDELRTTGEFEDLAGEIIRLTSDNMPLQAKLLKLHCGRYFGPWWDALVEQWEERAAIMEYDGGMSRHEAELAAAKLYRMEAFLDELVNRSCE